MKVIKTLGDPNIALVYLMENQAGDIIECTQSLTPPHPIEDKWVLTISSLLGCPVGCPICDAGRWYKGKLSEEEILFQINHIITTRYPDRHVPSKKFKIQFSRMGEPALNSNVLKVLRKLPQLYHAPGLMPSVSTIAPSGCDNFFEELMHIKNELYSAGKFQMQFSIHTTDVKKRDVLIPASKWSFDEIARYGERFFAKGDRKIVLNFPLAKDNPVAPNVLLKHFNPATFIIKLTPINPTSSAKKNKIEDSSDIDTTSLVTALKASGYDVIHSIGNLEENAIGSNCGQSVIEHYDTRSKHRTLKNVDKDEHLC